MQITGVYVEIPKRLISFIVASDGEFNPKRLKLDSSTKTGVFMTNSIIHDEILHINSDYQGVKRRIDERIPCWQEVISFNDQNLDIHFKTEGPLIPEDNGKIPILILLSNPHPHSVKQGMFLSPNRIGRFNPFWSTLRESGHFRALSDISAKTMITNQYDSPFRIFMAVLIAFPSNDPKDLSYIFGRSISCEMVKTGCRSLEALVTGNSIKHVICFGRLQYDAIAQCPASDGYTSVLERGGLIRSKVRFALDADVYLTFPTGWRFLKENKFSKTEHLRGIFNPIRTLTKKEAAMENREGKIFQETWFVLHQQNLCRQNPNLIGFRDPDEWSKIKKGDLVVYYQAGQRKLRGLFEVIESGTSLDPSFGKGDFSPNELKHQHKLKQIHSWNVSFQQDMARQLSFHKFLKVPNRWDHKRVFPLNAADMKFILSCCRLKYGDVSQIKYLI